MSNELVMRAIENSIRSRGFDHFRRPAGSRLIGVDVNNGEEVVATLTDLLRQVTVEDVTEKSNPLGAMKYFSLTSDDLVHGEEAVSILADVPEVDLAKVQVRLAHHQGSDGVRKLELILPGLSPRPTSTIHFLVGDVSEWPPRTPPTMETAQLVTWFPGRITPPCDINLATVKRA